MPYLRILLLAACAWLTGCRLATMPVIPTPRPTPVPPTPTPIPPPTATPTPAPTPTPVPVLRVRAPATADAEAALYGRVAVAAGAKTTFERGAPDGVAYLDGLKVGLLAGQGPDVFWIPGRELGEFQRRGWLLNLQPYAQADGVRLDGFRPAVMTQLAYDPVAKADGTAMWGLPREVAPQVLYLNLGLLKTAGGPDPRELARQGHWDWPALREAARRASDAGTGRYGFGMPADWRAAAAWIAGAGGEVAGRASGTCALTDDAAWRAIAFLAQVNLDRAMIPLAERAADAWLAGKLMLLQADATFLSQARTSGIDFDVLPLPAGPARATGFATWGAWVVNAQTRHPVLAWTLVQRLTGPDAQAAVASLGVPPARIDAAETYGRFAGAAGGPIVAALAGDAPAERPLWDASASLWDAAANAQLVAVLRPDADMAAARAAMCKTIDHAVFGR